MSGLISTLVGCTTTDRADHQFTPLPVAKVHAKELGPVTPRAMADILREAQENFEAANNAQESGDKEAALKHYTRMLELLSEANFDPAVFYNLRSEFKRILENSEQHAKLFERFPSELKPADIADRVSGDINIEFPLSDRILAEIEEIQILYPRNFQAGLDRSYKYLPFIRAELAKAGLPLDLVWLAMVESQFSPKVVSRAGAAGMWQFMRGTGARYGLRIDRYVDERFNWKKSTETAARYLRDLSGRFGNDWALAITAYNMGEGGLERVIAASGGEMDLWRLLESAVGSTRMQEESRKFYPKFVASILVANSPDKFGFMPNPQPPEKTVPVTVQGSYSLAALDKACGLPEGTLRALNPDLIRGVTPPEGDFALAVPPEASARLVTALHSVPQARSEMFASSSGRKTTHTVKRGETLSGIAAKYGVSISSLMKANRLRSSHHLVQGTRLTIPGATTATAEVEQLARDDDKPANAVYTVKKGDTLYEIAQHNKVSIKDLLAWNKKESTHITAGEKLVISPLDEMVEEARQEEAEELTHIVKPGESPAKIAAHYGVTVDDFLAWNKLSKASTIQIGQRLVVKGCAAPNVPPAAEKAQVAKLEPDTPATAPKETIEKDANQPDVQAGQKQDEPPNDGVHVVAQGETPGHIAEKYDVGLSVLLRYNNLTPKSVIRVGQKLKVPPAQTAKASSEPAPQPKSEQKTHLVAKGDNPSTIATRYKVKVSDLFKWNAWPKNVVLDIGDKVKVSE